MSDFESVGQILDRAIDEVVPGGNLVKIRLTAKGLRKWDNDDARRFQAGTKSGEPVLPLRNMGTVTHFELHECDDGRKWVRCPNRSQGWAELLPDDFEVIE